MVYYEQPPQEERPGCMDAVVLTRAVLMLLFWPLLVLVAAMFDLLLMLWLFGKHPALALLPIAATAALVLAYGVWERRRDERRLR